MQAWANVRLRCPRRAHRAHRAARQVRCLLLIDAISSSSFSPSRCASSPCPSTSLPCSSVSTRESSRQCTVGSAADLVVVDGALWTGRLRSCLSCAALSSDGTSRELHRPQLASPRRHVGIERFAQQQRFWVAHCSHAHVGGAHARQTHAHAICDKREPVAREALVDAPLCIRRQPPTPSGDHETKSRRNRPVDA